MPALHSWMVRVLEPNIFASLRKGVTSFLALFPFKISNSSTFRTPTARTRGNLGAIEALGDVLPPLNRSQFSCYPGCGFVHLFLRHSGYHGAQCTQVGLPWPRWLSVRPWSAALNLALLTSPCDSIETSERSSSVSVSSISIASWVASSSL